MNRILQRRLPRQLLRPKLPAVIDITEIPYYGQADDEDAASLVCRGRVQRPPPFP